MTLRIVNNNVNSNSAMFENRKVQPKRMHPNEPIIKPTDEKPVGEEQTVTGYYIEKTTDDEPVKKENDQPEDDEMDTSVNPNDRITVNPSIAIYKETDEITSLMEQSVERAISDSFNDTGEVAYYKATDMIKDKRAYNCFDDIKFENNFNMYGKAVYEKIDAKYNMLSGSNVRNTKTSVKMDLGLNYKSKSEKTKLMLFSSYTKTNMKTEWDMNIDDMPEDTITESNNKLVCLYGALKQQFKNDFGALGVSYINDSQLNSKTTNVDASYFLNKYMALFQGNVNTYKVFNQKAITKLDFNISFNPELASSQLEKKETSTTEAEPVKEEVTVSDPNAKKWSRSFSPFFDTQSINGSTEEGLGGQIRLKRTGNNSTFKVGTFGKISTTQDDENDQYHLSFGSGVDYLKRINSQSQFQAKAEIKDRITFGQGNILTANTNISFISPKITAEVEGKYINITHSDSPDYAGIVGRLFYTPNRHVNLFAEASYTDLRYPDYKISGSNVQTGVIVNF